MESNIIPEEMRKFSSDILITNADSDVHSRLKAIAFQLHAQEVAYDHNVALGGGKDAIKEKGLFWAIVRMRFTFVGNPVMDQMTRLSTWFQQRKGPYWIRNYELSDMQGNALVKGSSMWVIMNFETRAAERGSVLDESVLLPEKTYEGFCEKTSVPSDAILVEEIPYKVGFGDVDVNGHANNSQYLLWSLNAMDYDYCTSHSIKDVQITFKHEIKPAEEVLLQKYRQGENTWYVEGRKEDGLEAFTLRMEFE